MYRQYLPQPYGTGSVYTDGAGQRNNVYHRQRRACRYAGQPAAEYAIEACKALGADLSAHRSKSLLQEDLASVDLFVVMTMQHAQALMKLGVAKNKIYILHVSDPFGGNLETYTQCCEEIRKQLAVLLELIKKQEQKKTDE